MSVKKYGIYLAFGPRIDLRSEGLGRLLAEFLKATKSFEDTKFIIAAPRWLVSPLRELLENFNLNVDDFEIYSPKTPSFLSILYSVTTTLSERKKKIRQKLGKERLRKVKFFIGSLRKVKLSIYSKCRSLIFAVAKSRNPLVAMLILLIIVILAPLMFLGIILRPIFTFAIRISKKNSIKRYILNLKLRLNTGGRLTAFSHTAYRLMCDAEATAVADVANQLCDVEAWYSPTAFWPEFNKIRRPRLLCVPDVVPVHYSVAFAMAEPSGKRKMQEFKKIETTIEGGDRFVTYSRAIRDETLSDRFHIAPDRVDVIPHGTNSLAHLVNITGFVNNEEATDMLSAQYLLCALAKTMNNASAVWYASKDLGFLFYASQIRPNKNIMSLLRAYHYLRRTQNLPYKLVMTGNWLESPNVVHFMNENRLHDDVLFVHNLSEKELAACYRLATLTINPSLAEGGMPFTFTESLSVGTPVVMSDIPVSREIVTDEIVAEQTFFDGYDYKDIAKTILRSLDNIDDLYAVQRGFYDKYLASRSWHQVVGEYINALKKCSETHAKA